jgi:hypothetical protein
MVKERTPSLSGIVLVRARLPQSLDSVAMMQ